MAGGRQPVNVGGQTDEHELAGRLRVDVGW